MFLRWLVHVRPENIFLLLMLNDGRTIRVEQDRDGAFKEYERFEYDDLGRKVTYRRGDDEAFEFRKFFYKDENDRQIREEHVYESGTVDRLYLYRYEYNERDLLTARLVYLRPETEYKYDLLDRFIEEITNDIYFGIQPIELKTFEYY